MLRPLVLVVIVDAVRRTPGMRNERRGLPFDGAPLAAMRTLLGCAGETFPCATSGLRVFAVTASAPVTQGLAKVLPAFRYLPACCVNVSERQRSLHGVVPLRDV